MLCVPFCFHRSVFVGVDKLTGDTVALKRINTEQEENGFPITAIREVKILKALDYVNIIKLKEIVTSKGTKIGKQNIFLVFPAVISQRFFKIS